MTENRGLLSSGWSMVTHNKRYIFWFWLLNITLAEFGVSSFRSQAHAILDHSVYSSRLLSGFDLGVLVDLFARPESGAPAAMSVPAFFFAFVFFIAMAAFLPGVFQGYASNYRLPREDFFRACGRNLWRFIRLLIIAGIAMGIVSGILFAIQGALVKKAGDSTNEMLPFEVQMTILAIIFLVMTAIRIWFDLAEVNTVLSDQNAVRRSIGAGFRHTFRALGRLLASYVLITVVAAIFLISGLWIWMRLVPPSSVWGAFWIGQLILSLLLIPRFWQRGVAVAYYQQGMLVPVVSVEPITPLPAPTVVVVEPVVPPAIPGTTVASEIS
ncbi:MAG: hypothetical protein WB729_14405 [Candidatus Sulfotelmatobacter sp.]